MSADRENNVLAKLATPLIILATVIWGSSFVVMKNSVDVLPTFWLLAIRFTCAALVLGLVFIKRWKVVDRQYLIGGTVFSGRGPGIPVRIVSVSNVTADFTNEFSSAGINQTRHQIILNIKVDIDMLIPGGTLQDTVTTSMVIAETVIVGTVPGTYADMSGQSILGGSE